MTRTIQKKLVIPNINIYSGKLSKSWLEIKKVQYYNKKTYILETFWANLLEKNYDDLLARYFGLEKTLEFPLYKYYWLKIRVDIEKYIQDCNIYNRNKI